MLSDMPSNLLKGLITGLNPCSNGICSLTLHFIVEDKISDTVLILVLMEYAL